MERTVDKRSVNPGEDQVLSIRCSQCGGAIGKGRELIVEEKQFLCESCYRFMVNPDSGADLPSKWV